MVTKRHWILEKWKLSHLMLISNGLTSQKNVNL